VAAPDAALPEDVLKRALDLFWSAAGSSPFDARRKDGLLIVMGRASEAGTIARESDDLGETCSLPPACPKRHHLEASLGSVGHPTDTRPTVWSRAKRPPPI
jgi:hypothetical protein